MSSNLLSVVDRVERSPHLVTVKDAARRFHCSPKTMYRWIDQGMIPEKAVRRFGRTVLLDDDMLDEIAKHGVTDVRR